MLALTAPRVNQAMAYHGRVNELTPSIVRRSHDAIAKALSGGKHLTRAELAVALDRRSHSKHRWPTLGASRDARRARRDHLQRSAPGNQFTYALLDERVPPAASMERDEALLELARRYFSTRGPATAKDFAWWSGSRCRTSSARYRSLSPSSRRSPSART
jgi:hypothetical protein